MVYGQPTGLEPVQPDRGVVGPGRTRDPTYDFFVPNAATAQLVAPSVSVVAGHAVEWRLMRSSDPADRDAFAVGLPT